jgi:hypothetical protein
MFKTLIDTMIQTGIKPENVLELSCDLCDERVFNIADFHRKKGIIVVCNRCNKHLPFSKENIIQEPFGIFNCLHVPLDYIANKKDYEFTKL